MTVPTRYKCFRGPDSAVPLLDVVGNLCVKANGLPSPSRIWAETNRGTVEVLKTDKFESEVTRFIVEILRLAGIEDQPSYTRNQIINKSEETQNILLGAAYYDDEYITKKLLTINGDIDQYEDMMKRKAAEVIDLTEPVIDDGDQ